MSQEKRKWKDFLVGWRFGVLISAVLSSLVCIFNVAITLWVITKHRRDDNGLHLLYTGSCSKAQTLSTGIHVIINVLSTILLGASNYCMQCLSAPTRREIDKSHAKGSWMDIGVRSMRSLGGVASWKRWAWALFALTTLPLHLFYNSTIILSISGQDYYIYSANPGAISRTAPNVSFVATDGWNKDGYYELGGADIDFKVAQKAWSDASSSNYTRLDNVACIDAYNVAFQTTYGNVFLISSNVTILPAYLSDSTPLSFTDSTHSGIVMEFFQGVLDYTQIIGYRDSIPWLMKNPDYDSLGQESWDGETMSSLRTHASSLAPFGNRVIYCMAEKLEESCKLIFNMDLAITVIVLNLVKAILMTFLVFSMKESPIMTIGDAISSFLQVEDETTIGMCLRNRLDFEHSKWARVPVRYKKMQYRWFRAVRKSKWWGFGFWMFLVLSACISGLAVAIDFSLSTFDRVKTVDSIYDSLHLGLGTPKINTLVSFGGSPTFNPGAIARAAVVVNTPQVMLAFTQFIWNGLLTRMLTALEWNRYSTERRGLRVSSEPRGEQRSTYFLQVPYRYSVPFLAIFAVLHWLLSQAIFPVAVERSSWPVNINYSNIDLDAVQRSLMREQSFVSVGYSPLAALCTTAISFALLISFLFLGFRRFKSGMPIAANCSALISAACHLKGGNGEAAAREKLQWGCSEMPEGVGHCSFSNEQVRPLVEGTLYAGIMKGIGAK